MSLHVRSRIPDTLSGDSCDYSVTDPVPEVFITFLELPVSECELEYT